MIRGFVKLVVSVVLLVVIVISSLFAWGTTHNAQHGTSWPVLLVSLIFLGSCLWGLVLVWRSTTDDIDYSPSPVVVTRTIEVEAPDDRFNDAAFEAWLSANDFDSTDLPPESMAELRRTFLEQQQ